MVKLSVLKPEIAKTTEPKQSPKHEDPLRIPESGFIRGGEDPLIIESIQLECKIVQHSEGTRMLRVGNTGQRMLRPR